MPCPKQLLKTTIYHQSITKRVTKKCPIEESSPKLSSFHPSPTFFFFFSSHPCGAPLQHLLMGDPHLFSLFITITTPSPCFIVLCGFNSKEKCPQSGEVTYYGAREEELLCTILSHSPHLNCGFLIHSMW